MWDEFAQGVLQAEKKQAESKADEIEVCISPVTIFDHGDHHVLVLLAAACRKVCD